MSAALNRTRLNGALFGCFILGTTVSGLQIIASHLQHPILPTLLFGIAIAVGFYWLLFCDTPSILLRSLSSPILWLTILTLMAAVDVLHFSRTKDSPNPLSSAPALTLPANVLLAGHEPYSVHLIGDAPISPGPGWIILTSPLCGWSSIGILDALGLALAALALHQLTRLGAGIFVLACLVNPMFLSQAANGQDLYVISLAFVALNCLAFTAESTAGLFWIAILSGFVATSRVPMVILLCVTTLGLWRQRRIRGIVYGLTSLFTAIGLHAGFWFWALRNGDRYQPLHVFGIATRGAGGHTASVLSGCAWVLRAVNTSLRTWLIGSWVIMICLFVPVGLKEFYVSHFNLAWEGDNYVSFALPLLAASLALGIMHPTPQRSETCNLTAPVPE
jgi:hypothetical protein